MRLFSFISILGIANAITKGINIYGLETEGRNFVCSWVHPVEYYIDEVHRLGFNSLRIPFAYQWVNEGDFSKMDDMFRAVQKYPDMKVLLDFHRIYNTRQSYSPTDGISLDDFKNAWVRVLERYQHIPNLKAVDIFNEYQGGDAGYWNWLLHDVVQHIENKFPGRFTFSVGGVNWGGNIHDINLEDLPFRDRIQYTIHRYHFSGGAEVWDWDYSFGPFRNKVNVGEWGFKTENENEKGWAWKFISYLKERGIRNTFFWTIAHSGDTGGLWWDDCQNINWEKYNIIKTLWEGNEDTKSEL